MTGNSTTSSEKRLTGTVSVVLGASSGIGEATARLLAELGSQVVLGARRADQLDSIADSINAAGGVAVAQVTDVTNGAEIDSLVNSALSRFGRLDYAVNSAGMPGRGAFLETSPEFFDNVMNVNYRGTLLAMQAELPPMLEQKSGAIVNVSSVGGLVGVPGISAYVASKHAVVGLTKSGALELATSGVRINAIAPGGTDTEMLSSGTKEQHDFLVSLSPMKRISEPREVAVSIVYLLADATSTTGFTLSTDGGQSIG
ncbi:SDR family oxidoreductase [soil metagenome]